MASGWLISIDYRGLTVTASFMERLRKGEMVAWRRLAKVDLAALYRRGYSKLSREQMQPGIFWSEEIPATDLIPFVRGGPHPAPAWIPDYVTLTDTPKNRRAWKRTLTKLKVFRQVRSANETLSVKIEEGGKVTATQMKPNPKFELVVVNKHDRAALLKLLGELDTASNVETWLAERALRSGGTAPSVLHADYSAWCEQRGEAVTGQKSFVHALVAAGVAKLTRHAGNARYELELR